MKKPYAIPVIQALPAIATPEPRVSPLGVFVGRLLGRYYLAAFTGNARLCLGEGGGQFIAAFERSLSGKSRCILAFRHQNGWDPQVLMWFAMTKLARAGRKAGVRFARPPHLLFIHSYDILRWGGPPTRFLLPRIGAMPVHHVKLDSQGLARIYRSLQDGPYPLAIAPEGQVSYTLLEPPRIEPGTVRIGMTVAERLLHSEDGAAVTVEILPVTLYPEYREKHWKAVEKLTARIEEICGLTKEGAPDLRGRFLRCREAILAANEKRYGLAAPEDADFAVRLDAVIEAALHSAAKILLTPSPQGETINRIYAIRQTCWERIFPEDADLNALTGLERALYDLRAGEAWHAARHMETADFSWYFHKPPLDPLALTAAVEYAQNLYDFANRTRGGVYSNRRYIAPKMVRITAAEPVNLTELLASAEGSGESRKAVIAKANEQLHQAFRV
jgi:hypothetical protein